MNTRGLLVLLILAGLLIATQVTETVAAAADRKDDERESDNKGNLYCWRGSETTFPFPFLYVISNMGQLLREILPTGHTVPKWRRLNVDATSSRRIDVDTTSFLHHVPAG